MIYVFENENALELYFHITKELNISLFPKEFDENEEVFISEKFMMDCIDDILNIDSRFCKK